MSVRCTQEISLIGGSTTIGSSKDQGHDVFLSEFGVV